MGLCRVMSSHCLTCSRQQSSEFGGSGGHSHRDSSLQMFVVETHFISNVLNYHLNLILHFETLGHLLYTSCSFDIYSLTIFLDCIHVASLTACYQAEWVHQEFSCLSNQQVSSGSYRGLLNSSEKGTFFVLFIIYSLLSAAVRSQCRQLAQ